MADLQLDIASANRFISSLSKSLQALCHGCMDFDAGIEIVGYINVNIDSGSKVDYVLNEKVLKSTTNSMTFVSNSFLAKKEQPKSSKDGSCSPIPELNYPQHRTQGNYSYPATQLYRSSGIYSPHSQVVRGSQKRAWSGNDWRVSPRKFTRGARSQHGSSYQHPSPSQQNESYSSYSNPMSNSNSAIPSQQSLSSSQQDYDGTGNQSQSDVDIKKEVEESIDGTGDQSAIGGDPSDSTNGADTERLNIKTDPDAATNQDSDNIPTKSETDMSGSFLQPTKTDNEAGDPSTDDQKNVTNYEDSSYSEPYEETAPIGDGGEYSNAGSDSQQPLGADAGYEESGDVFPESSYSGEGTSGGGGQFEVIEIDDEDEDVAAMFDDTRTLVSQDAHFSHDASAKRLRAEGGHHSVKLSTWASNKPAQNNAKISFHGAKCHFCNQILYGNSYHRHMLDFHPDQMERLPFKCEECGKGFLSLTGLKYHQEIHSGESICTVCHMSFRYSRNLKRHMEATHQFKMCRYCKNYIKIVEFRNHRCEKLM